MADLSVPEVAERLGADRTTVWHWVRDGKFPNVYQLSPDTPGSPYRIPEADVEAFEEKRRGRQPGESQQNDN